MTVVCSDNFRHSLTITNENTHGSPQLVTLVDPDESAPSRDVGIFSISRLQWGIQVRC